MTFFWEDQKMLLGSYLSHRLPFVHAHNHWSEVMESLKGQFLGITFIHSFLIVFQSAMLFFANRWTMPRCIWQLNLHKIENLHKWHKKPSSFIKFPVRSRYCPNHRVSPVSDNHTHFSRRTQSLKSQLSYVQDSRVKLMDHTFAAALCRWYCHVDYVKPGPPMSTVEVWEVSGIRFSTSTYEVMTLWVGGGLLTQTEGIKFYSNSFLTERKLWVWDWQGLACLQWCCCIYLSRWGRSREKESKGKALQKPFDVCSYPHLTKQNLTRTLWGRVGLRDPPDSGGSVSFSQSGNTLGWLRSRKWKPHRPHCDSKST